MCEILVKFVSLLKLIRISLPPPAKSCVLDLCSYSYGDQVILLATVDCSVFLLLLLLFGGAYHNIFLPLNKVLEAPTMHLV